MTPIFSFSVIGYWTNLAEIHELKWELNVMHSMVT